MMFELHPLAETRMSEIKLRHFFLFLVRFLNEQSPSRGSVVTPLLRGVQGLWERW